MWEWMLAILVPLAAEPSALEDCRVRAAVAVAAARSTMEEPPAQAVPTKKGAPPQPCPNNNCPIRK
jgi:hypothetical protein